MKLMARCSIWSLGVVLPIAFMSSFVANRDFRLGAVFGVFRPKIRMNVADVPKPSNSVKT